VEVSYVADSFEHPLESNCSPYQTAPDGVSPGDYIQCTGATLVTDSNTEPPFYTWGEPPGAMLFDLGGQRNLSSVRVFFVHNSTLGQAKLRIWSVPDDFEIWNWDDDKSAYSSTPLDEVLPDSGVNEISQAPAVGEPPVTLISTRVLVHKLEDTKNYRFALTEVQFQEACSQGLSLIYHHYKADT